MRMLVQKSLPNRSNRQKLIDSVGKYCLSVIRGFSEKPLKSKCWPYWWVACRTLFIGNKLPDPTFSTSRNWGQVLGSAGK